jgi:hypothetical protein
MGAGGAVAWAPAGGVWAGPGQDGAKPEHYAIVTNLHSSIQHALRAFAGKCQHDFTADIFLHYPAFGCIPSPVSGFMLHCTYIIQHSGVLEGDGQGRKFRFIYALPSYPCVTPPHDIPP